MKVQNLMIAAAAGLFSFAALTGCANNSGGFGRPVVTGGDQAHAAPASFLRTAHGQLGSWLDGRYDVTYRNMRLGGTERENIFAQQPIEDVHYRFEDVGRNKSLFQLKADSISRREILYQIAKTYNLRMSIESIDGTPAFIGVKGDDRGSRYDPGQTIPDGGGVREL